MKVKDLIKKLSTLDQNAEVVVEGSDHSYNIICGSYEKTAEVRYGNLYEYYGPEYCDGEIKTCSIVLLDEYWRYDHA